MDKAAVNMKSWKLDFMRGIYELSGTADNHPKLGKEAFVGHTSNMISYKLKKDILSYETRNNIYMCPLKYMIVSQSLNFSVEQFEEMLKSVSESEDDLIKLVGVIIKIAFKNNVKNGNLEEDIIKKYYQNDEYLEHIIKLMEIGKKELEEIKKRQEEQLLEIAKKYENCIYIEMIQIAKGNELAYNIGGKTGIVSPCLHSSYSQDSVLYRKHPQDDNDISFDFRYWPMEDEDDIPEFIMTEDGNWIEKKKECKVKEKQEVITYSWSDNIARAVIKNDSNIVIEFNGEDIAIGETKVFTAEHHTEGLISPDCHNGKSLISPEN